MEYKDTEKIKRLLQQPEFENWGQREEDEICDPGERHDPSEIMERNAAFLIDSSRKIAGYDEFTLSRMQLAFDLGNYPEVIDLAYRHDREHRRGASSFGPVSRLDRVKGFVSKVLSFL